MGKGGDQKLISYSLHFWINQAKMGKSLLPLLIEWKMDILSNLIFFSILCTFPYINQYSSGRLTQLKDIKDMRKHFYWKEMTSF